MSESIEGELEKDIKDHVNLRLNTAVRDLTRVVCSGGVVMSLSVACTDTVEKVFALSNTN